ncbi:hypothetical protein [Sphingorhabdus profundilacus]|uniref:hypothetical protein n=1 Tax=Sphingorhabdus profundilacus TaxID=2509718 RepID=UPI001FE34A11|nr:hypothetical protein [Sphingorhabdus profundilacus]
MTDAADWARAGRTETIADAVAAPSINARRRLVGLLSGLGDFFSSSIGPAYHIPPANPAAALARLPDVYMWDIIAGKN